jgi:hypothetical protein
VTASSPRGEGLGVQPDDRRWLVPLPPAARGPLRVFVNGVPQIEGGDYRLERRGDRRVLTFDRPLQNEGRLGFWRWALMFFSIAGTYRRHDSIDVQYEVGRETRVATGLEIVPPTGRRPSEDDAGARRSSPSP